MHYEPLRPNRMYGSPEPYEFTHGDGSICVYDKKTLDFVKEIKVGTNPDCHAVSGDGRYLYIACFEGLYCIGIESLEVEKIVDTGKIYATNVLPDGNTLLVHDLEGGVQVIENINDMEKIRVAFRTQVLPERKFRSEIGGKGNFIDKDRFYLCAGWRSAKLYLLDEPIGGVDPAARDYILNTILRNYSENASVVLSTHLIGDIERALDEVLMLKDNTVFLHQGVDELREAHGCSVDEYFREVFRA